MDTADTIDALLLDTFEDVALLIGVAAAVHHLDDAVVRMLLRHLDRVRSRALSRLPLVVGQTGRELDLEMPPCSHPAIEEFLLHNRPDRWARRGQMPETA